MARDVSDFIDEHGFFAPLSAKIREPFYAAEDFPTGPEVGERLPNIKLVSADGVPVDLHADRGDSKAAVTFFRSAVW